MLLRPPYLQQGDKVCILSTARKITYEEIETAVAAFQSWGLEVIIGKTIGRAFRQFAGTDSERRDDLQNALDHPDIKAIICARGGYGTVRIMDDLDFTGFLKHPKWIVGFSDITYLHVHINNTLGVQTIHAPMPYNFPKAAADAIESLRRELFGQHTSFELTPQAYNRTGEAEGTLIGGNLSILYSITGTKSGINTSGKILFIEDLDEYLYHVDRMMINLKRSGKLQHLAGLLVGAFTDMKDNRVPFGCTAYEIIQEHIAPFSYPVCFGFPAGHIPDNRALTMGRNYTLSVRPNGVKFY